MTRSGPFAVRSLTRLITGLSLALAPVAAARPAAAGSCEDLSRLALADTTITSAAAVAAGAFTPPGAGRGAGQSYASLPAFCRVAATLRPSIDSDIKIEVWLPSSGWNGKLQAVGQGGLAGYIPYAELAAALIEGYATSGTDTGHVGDSAEFVLGHREKLIDFAFRAIHEMAVKSKAIVAAHYDRAPGRSYFNGCSGGGRHGLTSAQRFPADFDGIVAGASTWNQPRMDAARIAVNRIVNRTPESGLPPDKFPIVHKAVLDACDMLDGVKDGVIENPTRCRFDLKTIECKSQDGPTCLTPAQVESAHAIVSPLKHPKTGAVLFEGHLWPGAELEWSRLSQPEPLSNVLTRIRNITFKNPQWDPKTFNIDTDLDRADAVDGGLLASNDFNLKPFFDRGSKLLMWHGWSDPQVTPQNSTIYYNSVLKAVGASAQSSIALFMLAGVSHCQGGPGPDSFDKMSALVDWVERGTKPTRLIASHRTGGKVDRTRPLCPYGQVAKWSGRGSTDEAANFSCAVESMEAR